MSHPIKTTVLIAASLGLAGCAIFSFTTPQGKVKIVNETPGTTLCMVTAGHPRDNGYAEKEVSVGPGASAEVSVPLSAGAVNVCVKTCHPEHGPIFAGCSKYEISKDKVETLVLVEGKDNKPPNYDIGRHGLDLQSKNFPDWRRDDGTIAMYNVSDPNFYGWNGGPKDPWGEIRPGLYNITLENPVCTNPVRGSIEDNKGMPKAWSVGVESVDTLAGTETPVYMRINPAGGGAQVYIWDLPEGIYSFRVSDDCNSVDLISEEHRDGVESARPMGPDHEKNQDK